MVLPLWYTQMTLAMFVPIVRISKSPSLRGFVSGSRSNRASYPSIRRQLPRSHRDNYSGLFVI